MENFVRFQWYDAGTELKRNIGFLYKYGDNIYEKLMTKLEEYGFERSGSKKLYQVDYNDECVLIEDSDTLWSVMNDPNQVSGQPIRLETLEKPRKPRYCSGRDDRCTEAPNETAAGAAADSGAVTTRDVTAAATERPPEERPQAIAKTRRRLSRRRARSRSRSRAGTRSHTRSRTRSRSRSRSRGHRMESRGGTRSRSHTRSRSRSRSHSRGGRSHRYQRLHRLGQHHRSAPKHRASHRTPPLERRDLSSTSDSDYATGERHGASSRTLGELMKRLERVEAKLDKIISTTAPATR